MSQSDERVRGRRTPDSFGRPKEPEPEQTEVLQLIGGQPLHLVLHLEVVPSPASIQKLYDTLRSTTAAAVRDGYSDALEHVAEAEEQAVADMQAERAGQTPGDGSDGGPSSG